MSKKSMQRLFGSFFIFGLLMSFQNCIPPQTKLADAQSGLATATTGNDLHLLPDPPQQKLVEQEEVLTYVEAQEALSLSSDILGQLLSSEELHLKQEFVADSVNANFINTLRLRNAPREINQIKIGQKILIAGENFKVFGNLVFLNKDISIQDQDVIEAHYMILQKID